MFGVPAIRIGPRMAATRSTPIQVSHRSPDKRVHDHGPDSPAPSARFAHASFCIVDFRPLRHVWSCQLQQFSCTAAISAERLRTTSALNGIYTKFCVYPGRPTDVATLRLRFAPSDAYHQTQNRNGRSYYTNPFWEY